jgi:hypothetical protein
MDTDPRNRITAWLRDAATGLNPAKSKTFLLALGLSALAAWVWFRGSGEPSQRFPLYGVIGTSYAGGFLIGLVFRRVLRITAILGAFFLAGFALLHFMPMDTSKARRMVADSATWAQEETSRARRYLFQLLPSGTAAGVGAFAGARRRRNRGDHPPA